MERTFLEPVGSDEDRQEQEQVRFSELCRARDELLTDISGPMVPDGFSERISSFVKYSPLKVEGTDTGPLFFRPRAKLDDDLRSDIADDWYHLDEGNAEFVYSDHMSDWFTRAWDFFVRADNDWTDFAESEDWDLRL